MIRPRVSVTGGVRHAVACLAVGIAATACSSSVADPIELAPVAAGTVIQTVAAPASVEPAARRTATSPVAGEVAQILVEDGDRVDAGDVVLRLHSDTVSLSLAQAELGLEAAGSLAGLAPAVDLSPLIAPLRRQVDAVLPDLLDALEVQAQAIPDDDVRGEAFLRIADARARYQATSRDLAAAEAGAAAAARRASASQRAAAEAQRRQAEAALAAAEQREDALEITAPIDGVVELAQAGAAETFPSGDVPPGVAGLLGAGTSGGGPVAVGVVVVPGQTLFTVYDLSAFHVRATVDEVDAILVDEGQAATVFVDAYPDRTFDGRVRSVGIGPVEGASGGVVYPVTVTFAGLPDEIVLRVGMTASVEVAVRRVTADRVVPTRALLRRDDRDIVLVVRGDDRHVESVPIELLAAGEEDAAVDGALEPGEEVVVAGFEDLEDGDRVP